MLLVMENYISEQWPSQVSAHGTGSCEKHSSIASFVIGVNFKRVLEMDSVNEIICQLLFLVVPIVRPVKELFQGPTNARQILVLPSAWLKVVLYLRLFM
jgi:hypothetical protein